MRATSQAFKEQARAALANPALQKALGNMRGGFQDRRAQTIAKLPEWEDLRAAGERSKRASLRALDGYLELFEQRATAAGSNVWWARSPDEANAQILDIIRAAGAKTVTKGKSMVSEEIGLNHYLEQAGFRPVETDLGEYIIQLRDEPPSHIVAPAIHLNKEQVADAFRGAHPQLDPQRDLSERQSLLDEARTVIREKFLAAEVGITGANMLIAETGSTVIVTNEGNGDLTQSLPKVHIVLASLDKIVPTLEEASTILRLLPRSATGQEITAYVTFSTGPKRPEDLDGPEEHHIVILDNGRSQMLGGPLEDMLRCIRCAACMNHCPVYGAVGGHAYGWVYPGPMGSVLTPHFIGVEAASHLPNASTGCGRCDSVCPMKIPLTKMMRHWRERHFNAQLGPAYGRWGLGIWGAVARRPWLHRLVNRLAAWGLSCLAGGKGSVAKLPFAGAGWTQGRDFPAPEGGTFQDRYARSQRQRSR